LNLLKYNKKVDQALEQRDWQNELGGLRASFFSVVFFLAASLQAFCLLHSGANDQAGMSANTARLNRFFANQHRPRCVRDQSRHKAFAQEAQDRIAPVSANDDEVVWYMASTRLSMLKN
jgi:hypothetical protein